MPGIDGFTSPAYAHPTNKDSDIFNQPNQNPGSDKPGENKSNGNDDNLNFEPENVLRIQNSIIRTIIGTSQCINHIMK